MIYYVYVLYSPAYDRFYKGQSKDLLERHRRHNLGREKSTAPYRPWVLLWYTEKPSRSEALALELKLKQLSKEKMLKFMLKHTD